MQRTLKFVKYLPSFGWRPYVVTPRSAGYDYRDDSLVAEIPRDAGVFRTRSFEPHAYVARLRRKRGAVGTSKSEGVGEARRARPSLLKRIGQSSFDGARRLSLNSVFVPDYHVGWIPFAVANGVAIIRREKIDVVYATGDPWSSVLVALFLKWLTGTPFVMDMRDPWTLDPGGGGDGFLRMAGQEFWENRCISSASRVVNVTYAANRSYIAKYPGEAPGKFQCITQGFDSGDFEGSLATRTGVFTMSATSGFQTTYRMPSSLLMALRRLLDRYDFLKYDMRVNLMGMTTPMLDQLVRSHQLENVVKVIQYSPHAESVRLLMSSDVLLLHLNRTARQTSAVSGARVFEYLAARRPILAVVPPESFAGDIVASAGAGVVVDPDNVDEIAGAIYELYLQYKSGTLGVREGTDIQRYERRQLTGMLAALLDEAMLEKRKTAVKPNEVCDLNDKGSGRGSWPGQRSPRERDG